VVAFSIVRQRPHQSKLTTIIIGVAYLYRLCPSGILVFAPISVLATFIFNVMLFLFSCWFDAWRTSTKENKRLLNSVVLLTLQILIWFLLKRCKLAFKSLVLLLMSVWLLSGFERCVALLATKLKRNPHFLKDLWHNSCINNACTAGRPINYHVCQVGGFGVSCFSFADRANSCAPAQPFLYSNLG